MVEDQQSIVRAINVWNRLIFIFTMLFWHQKKKKKKKKNLIIQLSLVELVITNFLLMSENYSLNISCPLL